MQDKIFDTKAAADYLGVSASTLEHNRCHGGSIPFVKVGRRSIRYRQSVLDQYLSDNTFFNTIQSGGRS